MGREGREDWEKRECDMGPQRRRKGEVVGYRELCKKRQEQIKCHGKSCRVRCIEKQQHEHVTDEQDMFKLLQEFHLSTTLTLPLSVGIIFTAD